MNLLCYYSKFKNLQSYSYLFNSQDFLYKYLSTFLSTNKIIRINNHKKSGLPYNTTIHKNRIVDYISVLNAYFEAFGNTKVLFWLLLER